MTALAMKFEQKRLDRSAQTGRNQTQTPIYLALETRSRAQVARQITVSRHSGPKGLEWGTNCGNMLEKVFYLGNVGSDSTEAASMRAFPNVI